MGRMTRILSESLDPQPVVGVGVIGTGFGAKYHIPLWNLTPGVQVVAVCSRDAGRVQEIAAQFGIPHPVTDYRELATLPDVDLVDVVTPPFLHYPATIAAIDADKHVLCEKPMAMDAAQGWDMYQRAKAKGIIHLVNFHSRITPSLVEMHRLITDGYIGSLIHVYSKYFTDWVRISEGRRPGWKFQKATGGGWLGGYGSHMIDALRFLFGNVISVNAQMETVMKERLVRDADTPITSDTEDTFVLLLRFASGSLGTAVSSAVIAMGDAPLRFECEAHGTEGTLVLNGNTLLGGRKGQKRLEELPVSTYDSLMVPPESSIPAMSLWFQRIVEALREGRQISPNFEDGWRCQQIMDAAQQSAAEGTRVPIEN